MPDWRIRIAKWELQYDRCYGSAKKKGYSAMVNGSFVCQFDTWAIVAILKMFKRTWIIWREGYL